MMGRQHNIYIYKVSILSEINNVFFLNAFDAIVNWDH
jgi:hypothetical protein